MEPSPGFWGKNVVEYRNAYLRTLSDHLNNCENPDDAGIVLHGTDQGIETLKTSDSDVFKEQQKEAKEIVRALQTDDFRLLIGTHSNGCKVVAILFLD
jgi:hypothetical protein